jgi:hypothetical protein
MSSPFPTNLLAAADHSGRIAWVFSTRGERNMWIADAPNLEARQVMRYRGDDGLPIAALKLTPDARCLCEPSPSSVRPNSAVPIQVK